MRRSVIIMWVSAMASVPAVAASDMPGSSPAARQAMATFGRCVARTSPDKTRSVLARDFRTPSYTRELKALAELNRDCLQAKGRMRANGLPFSAALAEAVLKSDASPLNMRLARAATGKQALTFAPSDAIAMCIARSAPDEAAALFDTAIASNDETDATARLAPVARLCAQRVGAALDVEPFSLRSILATASFRLLAAQ